MLHSILKLIILLLMLALFIVNHLIFVFQLIFEQKLYFIVLIFYYLFLLEAFLSFFFKADFQKIYLRISTYNLLKIKYYYKIIF